MSTPDLARLVPPFVRRFEPYTPSRPDPELARMYGCGRILRLNNNENPLGPPASAQDVLRRFPPPSGAVYPSGDSFYLRRALSTHLSVDPDQILVGNGANEVIAFVIKAFCREGDAIVTADRTFAVYEWVAELSGITARLVPLIDFGFHDAGMLAGIDGRTKVVFLCNPNNPTGSSWDEVRLRAFLCAVAGRCIVVVDEAYFEFVETPGFPDGVRLIADHPNLIVFRTFSKMYGLAGLRVGYLVGHPEVVAVIRRTCVVYSVNAIGQEAAVAALADTGHVAATRALVRAEKRYLLDELARLGLRTVSGEGNFVMVQLPISDTLAYRKLMTFGVMIRPMTSFRCPGWIRVSIGRHDAMAACVDTLGKVLER